MSRLVVLLALATAAACAQASLPQQQIDAGEIVKPVDAAIDGNSCSVQPCSILPQCGCNDVSACDIDQDEANGTACRPLLTPGTETSSCTMASQCDRGFSCIGGSTYAACKKFCEADVDCGTPRGKCALQITAGGQPIPNVPKVCTSNCEPTDTTAAGCPSNFKCTLFTAASMPIADCALAGTGTQGVDCTSGTSGLESRCAKGYQCIKFGSETTFKCRRICTNPSTNNPGCGGQQCVGFSTPHTLGGTTYGICAP